MNYKYHRRLVGWKYIQKSTKEATFPGSRLLDFVVSLYCTVLSLYKITPVDLNIKWTIGVLHHFEQFHVYHCGLCYWSSTLNNISVICISLWTVLLVEYFEQYFSYMYIIVHCAIGRVLWTIFQLYVYHCGLCYWSSTLNNISVICI